MTANRACSTNDSRLQQTTAIAACNDIGPPSLALLGTIVPGVPMRSLLLSKVGVTEAAQLQ